MANLSKSSLNYYLSEYLEDLRRSGVKDFYRGPRSASSSSAQSQAKPGIQIRRPMQQQSAPMQQPTPQQPQPQPEPSRPAPRIQRPAPTPMPAPAPRLNVVAPNAAGDRAERLAAIAAQVAQCSACPKLVANRTQTVFGSGNPYAELCFIGEGPGAEEDLQGMPFVGRSGQLLTGMIEKGMGLRRADVFICNIVRCRPPQNRNPEREEADACRHFLDATLDVVQPKFICCLGAIAATNLLQVDVPIGKLRGLVHDYKGAKVVCTYHPAYLLRNPPAKKYAWEDLQLLMREMGLQLPNR